MILLRRAMWNRAPRAGWPVAAVNDAGTRCLRWKVRSILGWGNATCTNGHVSVSLDVFPRSARAADTSSVIADADRSLANFLTSALDTGTAVTFETPTDEWAKAQKRPAVSCFLHRVVEDIGRRNADWADERGPDGRVGAPPATGAPLPVALPDQRVGQDRRGGAPLARPRDGGLPRRGDRRLPSTWRARSKASSNRCSCASAFPCKTLARSPTTCGRRWACRCRASIDLTLVAPLRPTLNTDIAPPAEELTMDMERIGSRCDSSWCCRSRCAGREAVDHLPDPREVVRRRLATPGAV